MRERERCFSVSLPIPLLTCQRVRLDLPDDLRFHWLRFKALIPQSSSATGAHSQSECFKSGLQQEKSYAVAERVLALLLLQHLVMWLRAAIRGHGSMEVLTLLYFLREIKNFMMIPAEFCTSLVNGMDYIHNLLFSETFWIALAVTSWRHFISVLHLLHS